MQKLLILLLSLVISCHSITIEDNMREDIKRYLSKNMNDFKSYEPLEFSKVDTIYNFRESPRELALSDSIESYKKVHDFILARAKEKIYKDPKTAEGLIAESKQIEFIRDSLLKIISVEREQISGFSMSHAFRGKNIYGATVLYKNRFYFDTAFNITNSIDE